MEYVKLEKFFNLNPNDKNTFESFINYIDTSSVVEGQLMEVQNLTENYPSRAKRGIKRNDIIISSVRPYLKHYFYYQNEIEHAIVSTGFTVIRKKENATFDEKFLYYYLTSNYITNYLNNIAETSQTTFPTFSYKDIARLNIPNTPLPTQKKIAEILSNYDTLIENCQKRITCLEQMAQNLYKEWFVHFRFPGWEKANFENGLPAGWKIERMSSYCKITDGTHDTPKQTDEGIPLVTGRCISNGTINFSEAYFISKADSDNINKRSSLSTGDILFSNIGTIGNMCKVIYDRQFSVKNMIIFKPRTNTDSLYLYYFLQSNSVQQDMIAKANGASQQFVGLEFIRKYKILLPQKEILNSFESILSPLDKQKDLLQSQITNLRTQRDLLLPRLMSGKLETK